MNESHTLHRDSWDRIEEVMRSQIYADDVAIADTIAAQRHGREPDQPEQDAIALSGLPAAGKSHAAEKLSDVYDAMTLSMGDAIRAEYESRYDADYDSADLAAFAADWRSDAAHEIPEKVAELARSLDTDLVIIDGVRSVTDYETLDEEFDNFYLIDVRAPFYTRLERLTDRGREGEDEFDAVDLAERDENERENLGRAELLDEIGPDLVVENDRGEHKLCRRLWKLIDNNLPFEVKNHAPIEFSTPFLFDGQTAGRTGGLDTPDGHSSRTA